MERKVPFVIGETYHAYTRGVDKRVVCESDADYQRLQLLLYLCNSSRPVDIRSLRIRYKGFPSAKVFEEVERIDTLVDILAYAIMPNHFHLLLKEKASGGISRFMLKLVTAYSMYFNTKHERSGPLFTRPFRSQHIDSDAYLHWVFSYILLNPLSLHQDDWKSGIRFRPAASRFLQSYWYGSFIDHIIDRPASKILATDERLPNTFDDLDILLRQLATNEFTKGSPP